MRLLIIHAYLRALTGRGVRPGWDELFR